MSPIIYTPHNCETDSFELPKGTLWQCPDCDTVWELDYVGIRNTGIHERAWALVKDPRRTNAVIDAINKAGGSRG